MRITNMTSSMQRVAVVAVAASALFATTSGAQSGVGPRWQAWLGCWTAAQPGGQIVSTQASGPTVCVTPTADANVVDISTISDGKIVAHDRIDASGRETPINARNCTGVQKAQFSSDERRVYLQAATTCEGVKSATSAILAMTAQGEWIDVRNVKAYGDDNVRVARYRDAGMPSSIPSDIAAALNGRSMVSQSARIASGAPVGSKGVIEASHQADSSVVSAWLLERGQRFSLSADDLVALADAGVPAAVTDAMVAVSNPNAFGVARADRANSLDDDEYPANRRRQVYLDPYYDPYGYGYSRYGYPGYGYGSYYGGGYYGGGYYGGYYGSPIIVVTGPGVPANRGQMVKGQGYTQNQPSAAGDRRSTERSSSPAPSSSSGSSSGSSAPASSPAPASRPAPTRTANPKP
jgi:hypothetical protein